MLKKLRLKRKLLLISVPVLLIVSAVALYKNEIFYFSDFKSSIEVKYNFADASKTKEVLDKTVQLNNVASVDRVNNVIQFEGVTFENSKTNIQNIVKDYSGITYTVTELSSLVKGTLTALMMGLYLLFLVGIAIHFYFISNKGGELKIILGSYLVLLLNLTFGAITGLGLLSLVSRYYKITALDLFLLLITSIVSYLIYYISAANINEVKSFQSLGNTFKNFISKNYKAFLLVSSVLLLVTTIGLGTAFVIHCLLLLAMLVLSTFQAYWLGYMLEDFQNIKSSVSYRFSSIRKFRIRGKKKVSVQPTPSKKKDKKKKKK